MSTSSVRVDTIPTTRLHWFLGAVLGMAIVLVPVGYRSVQSVKYRNFRVVTPGVLYRSGQLSEAGFAQKAQEYQFKTVVSLRELRDKEGQLEPDHSEIRYCAENGIRHVLLRPATWHRGSAAAAPVEANLKKFLAILEDPANHPVLVHCFAGIHRTGGYVAMYRMKLQQWPVEDALREMWSMGTVRTKFDPDTPALLRELETRPLGRP